MTLIAPKPVLPSLVRSIFYVILAIWAFVCLFPFYWLAVTSLKDDRAIGEGPSFFPFVDFVPTLRAWSFVFGDPSGKIGPYLTNSMVVSLAATSLALLFGGMAVYGVT